MPSSRNPPNPRRRSGKRRTNVPRSLTVDTVYRFVRTTNIQFGIASNAGFCSSTGATVYGNGLGIGFSLNNILFNGTVSGNFSSSVPSASEFVNLFDRFKIEKVVLKFIPTQNNSPTVSNTMGVTMVTWLPVVQLARDYDDYTAPTASSDLVQRTDCSFHRFDSLFDVSVRPKYSISTGIVGGTAVAGLGTDWLDTAASGQDTIYAGVKLWSEYLSGSTSLLSSNFMLYVTIHFAFKTPR